MKPTIKRLLIVVAVIVVLVAGNLLTHRYNHAPLEWSNNNSFNLVVDGVLIEMGAVAAIMMIVSLVASAYSLCHWVVTGKAWKP